MAMSVTLGTCLCFYRRCSDICLQQVMETKKILTAVGNPVENLTVNINLGFAL